MEKGEPSKNFSDKREKDPELLQLEALFQQLIPKMGGVPKLLASIEQDTQVAPIVVSRWLNNQQTPSPQIRRLILNSLRFLLTHKPEQILATKKVDSYETKATFSKMPLNTKQEKPQKPAEEKPVPPVVPEKVLETPSLEVVDITPPAIDSTQVELTTEISKGTDEVIINKIFGKEKPELTRPSLEEIKKAVITTEMLTDREKKIMTLFLEGNSKKTIVSLTPYYITVVHGDIYRGKLVLRKIFGFDDGVVL